MTSEISCPRPALPSLNVLVRGGRLTKFKGRVASIAPGLLVATTAAVLFSGGAAHAANECGGAEQAGQDTVTCDFDAQGATTRLSNGIEYNGSDGLTLEIVGSVTMGPPTASTSTGVKLRGVDGGDVSVKWKSGSSGTMTATGSQSNHAIHARINNTQNSAAATNSATVTVEEGGNKTIITKGVAAHALYASTDSRGSATVQMTGGTVITEKGSSPSHGLFAQITNSESQGTATAVMTGGNVETRGNGLYAQNAGGGNAMAQIDGTIVTTAGDGNRGVFAESQNQGGNDQTVKAVMTGESEVKTDGEGSSGLWAKTAGNGTAEARMEAGKIQIQVVDTLSEGIFAAHGLFAQATDASEANVTARMVGEDEKTITISGAGYGLYAVTKGKDGAALAEMENGAVTVERRGRGLFAEIDNEKSAATATAKMTGGTVTVSSEEVTIDPEDPAAARGLHAKTSGSGEALAQMTDGMVSVYGGVGLYAEILNGDSTAIATAVVAGNATVTTSGEKSYGVHARTTGKGKVIAQLEGDTGDTGKVATEGEEAHGIYAEIFNGDSTATAEARMTAREGEVTTKDDLAHGLFARNHGTGEAVAEMKGGEITTEGTFAYGIFARSEADVNGGAARVNMSAGKVSTTGKNGHALLVSSKSGSGNNAVEMTGGEVTTEGEQAHGLWVRSIDGDAIVNLGKDATVSAKGQGSSGIIAQAGSLGVFDVDVAGKVTGGDNKSADDIFGPDGAAIRTISGADGRGTIDIAETAIVTAGASGLAIVDGDGDTTITSAGRIIIGDILLGAGNDTLELTGGRFLGDIRGGAGDDTVIISALVDYGNNYILDGGTGNNQLTLQGQTMVTTGFRLTNWDLIELQDNTVLSLEEVISLGGALSIDDTSEFRASSGGLARVMVIRGDVTNNGDLTLSVQDGKTGDVITIQGDYTGSGTSVFALDNNGSDTDRLVIEGDTSGDIMLSIATLDGAGAAGGPLEIDVVSVGGASNGTFTLIDGNYVTPDGERAVISGAYVYRLAETGDGWALNARSETGEVTYQSSAPIYDGYGQALLAMNGPASLHARGSSQDFRSLAWDGGTVDQNTDSPLWVRMGGERITSSEEHSTTGAALKSNLWEMEIGADIVLSDGGAGFLVGGLMFSYGTGSTAVSSDFGDGSIDTSGLGVGLAATWYDRRGFYVDGQVTLTSYASDLSSNRFGTLKEDNSGTGLALSLEAGQQFDLGSRLTVIPQAQLSLSSVEFDDFAGGRYGEQVAFEEAVSQQLRLGLEFEAQAPQEGRHLYGIVNLFHEFGAGSAVGVGPASLTTEREPWAVGFGLGGSYALTDRVDLFGEASYATGLSNAGDASALSASAGIKVAF